MHAPAWGATVPGGLINFINTVSIHAPAWGATAHEGIFEHDSFVSIHAPAWGATLRSLGIGNSLCRFNPRARMGRDHQLERRRNRIFYVSIHAPAWGATADFWYNAVRLNVSIHAPAWGATCRDLCSHARGCCFNPRARMGRDLLPG
nr:hypothetical protein N47_B20850 [uncultured Desulfobacterium sp.]